MNKKIDQAKLMELIPENLRNDPDIIAAAQSTDKTFLKLFDYISKLHPLGDLESATDEQLEHLIWQFKLDGIEGGWLAETREEKINLLRNGPYLKRKKGTTFAVRNALETLNMRGQIKKWFEYGGEPYHFKIDINVRSRGLDERTIDLLEKLIETYKNQRSILEVIRFFLSSQGSFYFAPTIQSGETVTVLPWQSTNIQSMGNLRSGTGYQSVETVTIYPGEE